MVHRVSTRKRESRRDQELRDRLEAFCAARRSGSRVDAWIAWYAFRARKEDWLTGDAGHEVPEAYRLFGEVVAWQSGSRPPTTFHEANARIRRQLREGRLRYRAARSA